MYQKPNWFNAYVLNPMISILARLGLSIHGAQVLTVTGRTSGKARSAPVNPLAHEGAMCLVAPRGDTHWARNLRAAGEADLRLGRKVRRIRATEVEDVEKPPLLHAYLERWGRETSGMFKADASTSLEELAGIAADHPVFLFEDA
jgi:deazaflavin-dependent oxidoreductase (nitroreductase family)